jgi:hypothetical protein
MRFWLAVALGATCLTAPALALRPRHAAPAAHPRPHSTAPARPAAPAPDPAAAARLPSYAPDPAWVETVDVPAPDPARVERSSQMLLASPQSYYAVDRADYYERFVILAQTAESLQSIGNLTIVWNPAQSSLIIHHVRIRRGGQVIDLLANGQRFTVLQRGNNLESAVLDGNLTAVMQAEGLQVGDVIDVAWTASRRANVLPLRAENVLLPPHALPARKFSIRQTWAPNVPIQWRGTGALAHPDISQTGRGTRLAVDLNDAFTPAPPAMVPPRLAAQSTLELTQFHDWPEISGEVAPYFQRAAVLAPNSPLNGEIARIAALSPDPRIRTMAALRLVQDQVRYFALTFGAGNYLPASADESWSRRYADCKGKSVMLVALLKGLGIDAEPVAVSASGGDLVHERLPMLGAFNHVIVRARIGGQSYWLDGTRTGDRAIEDLAVSTLRWGLPLRTGGAVLEQIPFGPPSVPLFESRIEIDASHGADGTVPLRFEELLRGQGAAEMRAMLARLGREDFLRQTRTTLTRGAASQFIRDIDFHDDPEAGTFSIIVTGTISLYWGIASGPEAPRGTRRLPLSNLLMNVRLDAERPEGPYHDAPVLLPAPFYSAEVETVLLPNSGLGFSVQGADIDRTILGTRFTRHARLENGRAIVRSEVRRVAPEVSVDALKAEAGDLRQVQDDRAWLQATTIALRFSDGVKPAPSAPPVVIVPPAPAPAQRAAGATAPADAANPGANGAVPSAQAGPTPSAPVAPAVPNAPRAR